MKVIPLDTRNRILARYDKGKLTRAEVGEQFQVSEDFVKKLLKQRKRLGHAAPLYGRVGRKRSLAKEDGERMLAVIRGNPGVTLEELRDAIGAPCVVSTVFFALRRMGVTYKKNASGVRAGPRGRPQGAGGVGGDDGGAHRAIARFH